MPHLMLALLTLALLLCASSALAQSTPPEIVAGTHADFLVHRDALARDSTLLRYHTFEGLTDAATPVPNSAPAGAPPLTFRAARNAKPDALAMRPTVGRWPAKTAAHLDAGAYTAPAPTLATDSPFTAMLWFRKVGHGTLTGNDGVRNGMLLAVGNGYWKGFRLTTSAAGAIGFEIGRPQPGSSVGVQSAPVPNHLWHHLAATWDGQHMRLYLNGELAAERLFAGPYTPPPNDKTLRIGYASAGVGSAAFDVDEAALYARALSPREILASYLFYANLTPEQLDLYAAADTPSLQRLLAQDLHPDLLRVLRLRLLETQLRTATITHTDAARQLAALLQTPDLPTRLHHHARNLLLAPLSSGFAPDLSLYSRLLDDPALTPDQRLALRLGQAHAHAAAGDLPAALRAYTRLAEDPDAPAPYPTLALLSMARAQTRARDYDAATQIYLRLKRLPGEPRYRAVEADERIREIARLKLGQPASDPLDSRTALPDRPASAITLHVHPDGNDQHPGTREQPFATLARARDHIRSLRTDGKLPAGGIDVLLAPGRYPISQTLRFTAEDAGTPDAPITYRSLPGAPAILDAGTQVTGFTRVTDPAILERLLPEARPHVYQADLRAQEITNLGEFTLGGFASARGFRTHPVLEPFFNGQPLQLARWPNEGYVHIAAYDAQSPGTFTASEDRLARWTGEKDPWLHGYWYYDWADSYEKIASINPDARRIALAPPFTRYGEGGFRAGQRFYALNLLSEIDAPGEYYLDRETGILYLYPPSDPNAAVIQVSLLDKPLLDLSGAAHIRFEGLTFENGQSDGILVTGGQHVQFIGCTLRQFAGNAIYLSGGANHAILSCNLHTLGRGGAVMIGGDRKTLTPANHVIENTHIHTFSRIDHTYTPAILLNGVGNRIAHNLIHDARSSAMRIEGNDHLIEYNRVHNVLKESDDQGGADMWGNPTYRGNVFRYNHWHDLDTDHAVGGAGIRLDDFISGTVIYGNIFERAAAGRFGGVQIHGGKQNLIENNLFIDCRAAVSGGAFPLERWQRFLASPEGKQRFNEVNPAEPPYAQRYPELQHIEQDLTNFIWRNIAINCGSFLLHPATLETAANLETVGNPGLSDNLAIVPGSPLDTRLDFAPIPAGRIGLYPTPFRGEP